MITQLITIERLQSGFKVVLEWFANNTVVSNPGKFQICCLVDLKVAFASRK